MKKLITLVLGINLSVFGCTRNIAESDFALREGDLLFQDTDCGPLCDAIEKVTTGYHGANFTHVGIVAKNAENNFVVVEARPGGVQATPLKTFLGQSLDAQGRPKVAAGRLKPPYRHLISAAVKEAFGLIGRPYDRPFVIGNDAYYCSELIYEIFLRANSNNPVFELQPMTFIDGDSGVTLGVWQQYFSELGVCVPEGKPGINPGGISRSPKLTIVHLYGVPDGWPQTTPAAEQRQLFHFRLRPASIYESRLILPVEVFRNSLISISKRFLD